MKVFNVKLDDDQVEMLGVLAVIECASRKRLCELAIQEYLEKNIDRIRPLLVAKKKVEELSDRVV